MPSPPKTLYVLPDAQRVDAALNAKASAAAQVDARAYLTWADWLARCDAPKLHGKKQISPTAGMWLVHTLVSAAANNPFDSYAHEPRFAAHAWDLILHLKSQLATPARLHAAAQKCGGEAAEKARFLAQAWSEYDAALSARKQFDGEDVLRAVTAQLEEAWPTALVGVTRLELLHFYDFPPSRVALLLALARQAKRQKVQLAVEVPGGGPDDIDALANEIFAPLEQPSSEWEAELRKTDELGEGRPLAAVAAALFQGEEREVSAPGLTVVGCATPRDELREVARGIRARIDEGCTPEALAVAARDLGPEAEMLEHMLASYGVPARARRGEPLTSTPLGRLALELPRLVEHDFPRADVLRWLEEERFTARHPVPDGALALLQREGLRDNVLGAEAGQGAYAFRLQRLAQRSLEGQRRRVQALAASIEQLIRAASTLREPRSPEAFLDAWWKALETLGLLDAAPLPAGLRDEPGWEKTMLHAAARDRQSQRALATLKDTLREAMKGENGPGARMDLDGWGRWLNQAAHAVSLPVAGPRAGAVTIIDLRELAGRSFQHLWLLGMTEGRFPSDRAPVTLLSESERHALNLAAGSPLFRLGTPVRPQGSMPLRLAEDRLLFHVGLSAALESVTLSHGATDNTGRPVPRSSFIDDLERRVPSLASRQVPRRAVATLGSALNEEELRQQAALESVTAAAERLSPPQAHGPALVKTLESEPWLRRARDLSAQARERLEFHGDETRAPGAYSGRVDGGALKKPLRELFSFGPEHPINASWLETFGNCHFQGFAQRLLLREEHEEEGEDTSTTVHGKLLHRALEYWVRGWKEPAGSSLSEEERLQSLEPALREAAVSLEQEQHTGHPRLWELTIERSRDQLLRLWRRTALHTGGQASARMVETSFGNDRAPSALRHVVLPSAFPGEEPIYLRGAIDRWDQGATHSVVDYKRSKPDSKPRSYRALGTSHFQLPIYLLAVRQAAGAQTPVEAAWLGVRHASLRTLSEVLSEGEQSIDELLATDAATRESLKVAEKKNIANAVHGLLGQLREGDFGARPQDCKYCSVKSVCRISTQVLRYEGDEE